MDESLFAGDLPIYITTRSQRVAFRTSPVEALHVNANDPLLELRRNELGLKFLYKLKSNTSYIETLNTLNDREDKNYKENERSIKLMVVYLRRLEQRYIEEQNII